MLLATRLTGEKDPVVFGIARGGVAVAAPVAASLQAPLDVIVIRKIGHPLQPELALGAASSHGDVVFTEYARELGEEELRARAAEQVQRARELESRVRGTAPLLDIEARNVILVDDGIATSATMLCAVAEARRRGAARVVCAVPVAPADYLDQFRANCDEFVVLIAARDWHFAVGRHYADFREVTDEEVRALLQGERGAA
ncbi:MAG TPA: phosphoribosyltransferase family protein [Candidatus Tumulicola sp.]|nr:phosphoribosyltransferase family protein [Candidatus Tumulicola sp.]